MVPDPRTIMYVERKYDWYMNHFMATHVRKFNTLLAPLGYDFCYIPNQPQTLGTALSLGQIVNSSLDFLPSFCKFSHMEGRRSVFFCMELDTSRKASLVMQFFDFVHQVQDAEDMMQRVSNASNERRSIEIVEATEITGNATSNTETSVEEDINRFKQIVQQLRQRGVDESTLQSLVAEDSKPSRLLITQDNRILLPDYNNAEVALQPVLKAVFLFFLRHPEGLRFKELYDYKDEILMLYINLADRGSRDSALKTVQSICNPMSNSINEKCTRIREAFLTVLPDRSAIDHYCITGARGERRSIILDRNLVKWENPVLLLPK